MNKILVTYATMAGSTAEVAQAVGEELAAGGWRVPVRSIGDVQGLEAYDAVVVGGPMILGWHRAALRFLRKHRQTFRRTPLAVFVLAMSLTQTEDIPEASAVVFVDEGLPKPPALTGRLTFRERYARLSNYLRPIYRAARPAKPVSIGVFGGRLEYGRLKWWAVLFAMLLVQAPAGERRNWTAIRSWAAELSGLLKAEASKTAAS